MGSKMTNVLSDEELFRLLPECCPTTRQVETELLVRAIQKQPIAVARKLGL